MDFKALLLRKPEYKPTLIIGNRVNLFNAGSGAFFSCFIPNAEANISNLLKAMNFRGKFERIISAKKANLQGDLRDNFLLIGCYVPIGSYVDGQF